MKAGDKAWIFLASPQEIKEFKVTSVYDEQDGKTYVEVEWVLDDGRIMYADDFILGFDIIIPSSKYHKRYFETKIDKKISL